MTDKVTESSAVEFPATAEPQTQRVEITLPAFGLYAIEARAGGRMLRPSDVKAGFILSAEPPAAPEPTTGDLELAAPFTDGAVLQRNVPLPVWGWARAGEKINVTLADCTAQTVANADGTWRVVLGPLPAGGPFMLEVKGEDQRSLTVGDILAGEVWLLSGPSNTGGPLLMSIGGEEAAATADFPQVRVFNTRAGPDGRIRRLGWMTAQSGGDPNQPCGWLGIHFGYATSLHREQGVPIGLISSARGGTVISTWTSVQAHRDNDVLRPMLESRERRVAEFARERAHVLDLAGKIRKWRNEAAVIRLSNVL